MTIDHGDREFIENDDLPSRDTHDREMRARKARESIYVEGSSLFTSDGEVDQDAITQLLGAIERRWPSVMGGPSGAIDGHRDGDAREGSPA